MILADLVDNNNGNNNIPPFSDAEADVDDIIQLLLDDAESTTPYSPFDGGGYDELGSCILAEDELEDADAEELRSCIRADDEMEDVAEDEDLEPEEPTEEAMAALWEPVTASKPARTAGESGSREEVAPWWYDIGRWAATPSLKASLTLTEEDEGVEGLWELREGPYGKRWVLLRVDRKPVIAMFHRVQRAMGVTLKDAGNEDAAKKIWSAEFLTKLRDVGSPFWTGFDDEVRREEPMVEPPPHLINTPAGVLDTYTGICEPIENYPQYLFTACTNAVYIPHCWEEHCKVLERRLGPAMPEELDRMNFVKGVSLPVGGDSGGYEKGSLMWLIGSPGGGKGNTQRFLDDTMGDYSMPIDPAVLLCKTELNPGLATIAERNPRVIMLAEPSDFGLSRSLAITGRDAIAPRSLYKVALSRRLRCSIVVSSVKVPQADSATGLARRLFAFWFRDEAAVTRSEATDETTEAERNALFSLAVTAAIARHRDPDAYVGLEAGDPGTEDALRRADPMAALIATLGPEDHGKAIKGFVQELAESGNRPKNGSFEEALRATGKWDVSRRRYEGGPAVMRMFWLETML